MWADFYFAKKKKGKGDVVWTTKLTGIEVDRAEFANVGVKIITKDRVPLTVLYKASAHPIID